MFGLFKRKPKVVTIPNLGEFSFRNKFLVSEYQLVGRYSSEIFDDIELVLITKTKLEYSEYHLDILKNIENNWSKLKPSEFFNCKEEYILIPYEGNENYDDMDYEIGFILENDIRKVVVVKDNRVDEILQV